MELPVINVKKRSSSKDEGAARSPRVKAAALTAFIAATAFAALDYRRRHPPPPPPPLEPGQILTCGLRHGSFWPWYYAVAENTHTPAPHVTSDLVVSITTQPERAEALPIMLRSLVAGKTVPGAIYIVDSHERPNECPHYFSRNRDKQHTVDVHFVRTASDRGPIEKYIGAQDAIRKTRKTMPRFLLVLDDDHEYSPHVVERYSKALRASPSTVFTVQSPPSQLAFRPRFPVAYGSRGVGIRLDLALDGALAAYAAMASRLEPTCRVVDDIVVSAFLAVRGVTVKDVPGFSFENRPWQSNRQIHALSKKKQLRSADRDAQNGRCHDALVRRNWRAAAPRRRRAVQKRMNSASRVTTGERED
jgi:hypothetical protein